MLNRTVRRTGLAQFPISRRPFNFASNQYAEAFHAPRPKVDAAALRRGAVAYLDNFSNGRPAAADEAATAVAWGAGDPVRTVLRGAAVEGGKEVDTLDAFGQVSGKQLLASPEAVESVIAHCKSLTAQAAAAADKPDPSDPAPSGGGAAGLAGGPAAGGLSRGELKRRVRLVEAWLLEEAPQASALIGNQCLDFGKQDGVTEIVEALEANPVERQMVDDLLASEARGELRVDRRPALVAAVSNFSNFLDLCRKTLRNLEAGVPVVVLSRANTGQHVYRWFQLLREAMQREGVPPELCTFLSADLEGQRRLMAALPESPVFFTGSREVACALKELSPLTFASTGGPNTLVASEWTPPVSEAARVSACIENSGQCTALRHLVAPGLDRQKLEAMFDATPSSSSAAAALQHGHFAALLEPWAKQWSPSEGEASPSPVEGYSLHAKVAACFKLSADLPTNSTSPGQEKGGGLEEHWRRVVVDATSPPGGVGDNNPAFLASLSEWLVREQPITLAVNEARDQGFKLALPLFENTAQVVCSAGDVSESPALTCQARPQDGEIFGEFPPRRNLARHTHFPVVVPSPTPGYTAAYTREHLERVAAAAAALEEEGGGSPKLPPAAAGLVSGSAAEMAPGRRGYLVLLARYLAEAANGPYRGVGRDRTSLWGLMRPPLQGGDTLLRLGPGLASKPAGEAFGIAAAYVLPFLATNAHTQLVVSVHPSAAALALELQRSTGSRPLFLKVESDQSFHQAAAPGTLGDESGGRGFWNVLELGGEGSGSLLFGGSAARVLDDPLGLPLVGHFVSLLLPLGHVKSTCADDAAFLRAFEGSPKWLKAQTLEDEERSAKPQWADPKVSCDI